MSYLYIEKGIPDFKKAVISFWFRVPQDSLDAVAAQAFPDSGPTPRLMNILPLVVWGPELKGHNFIIGPEYAINTYTATYANKDASCNWILSEPQPGTDYASDYIPGQEVLTDQSYVGIQCLSAANSSDGKPSFTLKAHIQMKDLGSGEFLLYLSRTKTSDYTVDEGAYPEACPGPMATLNYGGFGCITQRYYPGGDQVLTGGQQDFTDVLLGYYTGESFEIGGTDGCKIKPDKWNHVLLSFNLNGLMTATGSTTSTVRTGCEDGAYSHSSTDASLTTGCRAYLAINDVNLTDGDINPFNVIKNGAEHDGSLINQSGPNALASFNTIWAASTGNNVITSDERWGGLGGWVPQRISLDLPVAATFSYTPSLIPAKDCMFGIPGTPSAEDAIHVVEMAEFLMFTDFDGDFDTGVEENRRLFITKQNQKGQQFPVNPSPIAIPINKLAIGDPATWEPGADIAAFVPGLVDPAFTPTAVKLPGSSKPVTADIDFTKCSVNWIIGNNMGTTGKGNKPEKTGKIIAYFPDPVLEEVP